MARDWMIEGKYVEYCSCDLGCPCEAMADPTQGHCTGLVGFKIDKGQCDGVALDDLSVVATFYYSFTHMGVFGGANSANQLVATKPG